MSKAPSVYAIQQEYQILFDTLAQADDLPPEQLEELLQLMNITEHDFHQKAEAYAVVINEKLSEAERLRKDGTRLIAWARSNETQAEHLKERILLIMQMMGWDKQKTDHWRFGLRSSEAVELTVDPSLLPAAYRRVKFEADKTAIKAALERGEVVPGAALVKRQSLQIR